MSFKQNINSIKRSRLESKQEINLNLTQNIMYKNFIIKLEEEKLEERDLV